MTIVRPGDRQVHDVRPDPDLPILIAGGGIGGLSAAIALSRQGVPVHVLEAAPEFAELGAGLQIGPNGTHILQSWSLGESLHKVALRPQALRLYDGATGRLLAAMPLGDVAAARYGAPYLVMTRHALHRLLLEAALADPNIALSRACRIDTMDFAGSRVAVHGHAGAEPMEGSALVAADGIHSSTRGQLFPKAKLGVSGQTALRSITAASFLPVRSEEHAVSVWMTPDLHLVSYPITSGGQRNVVAVLADDALPNSEKAMFTAAEISPAFKILTPGARHLLDACEVWTKWPLFAMPPLAHWSRGPVTLLGDAAHPVLPFLASGAVMAIEDAAVLAQEVARTPTDRAGAFRRYEDRRRPRLGRLQAAAARMGEIYHMRGAMRLARNLTLSMLPESTLLARNDWLYGFRI